ncbi:MAG: DUF6962 family protein [Bacteroidota bacterium]
MNEFLTLPHINVFGVIILEPFTVLTDLLIAAVCFWAYFKLKKEKYNDRVHRFFRMFLIGMGVATTIGGVLGHGFIYIWGKEAKIPGWYVSMFAIAMFERAAIMHSRPLMKKLVGDFFAILNIVELLTFMTLAYITVEFIYVEIHAVYGLFIVVFSFELYVYYKTREKACLYLFTGTLLAAIAALSHGMRIAVNEWFNHNDVSHVLMAGGMYYYYLYGKHLKIHTRK